MKIFIALLFLLPSVASAQTRVADVELHYSREVTVTSQSGSVFNGQQVSSFVRPDQDGDLVYYFMTMNSVSSWDMDVDYTIYEIESGDDFIIRKSDFDSGDLGSAVPINVRLRVVAFSGSEG